MPYCKVAECRFNYSHVTSGHLCGRCASYGHGELECIYPSRKTRLQSFLDDTLPNNMRCMVADCQYSHLHTTDAHHCPTCKRRQPHAVTNCPMNISNSIEMNGNTVASNINLVTNANVTSVQTDKCVTHVKCPICRADNYGVSMKKIMGLTVTDKCCICLENNVEILLPNCYHCCMCLECLKEF